MAINIATRSANSPAPGVTASASAAATVASSTPSRSQPSCSGSQSRRVASSAPSLLTGPPVRYARPASVPSTPSGSRAGMPSYGTGISRVWP